MKTIDCVCLVTIGLIVAPWKFDVLKTSIFSSKLRFSGKYFDTLSPPSAKRFKFIRNFFASSYQHIKKVAQERYNQFPPQLPAMCMIRGVLWNSGRCESNAKITTKEIPRFHTESIKDFRDYILAESNHSQEGRQIANHDCRVYQHSFSHRHVHCYVLRNSQDLPRVKYAVKTSTFGCDDTCAVENTGMIRELWWLLQGLEIDRDRRKTTNNSRGVYSLIWAI